jgi:predicted Zn-dependent peptidase
MDVYGDTGAFDVEAHSSPGKLVRTAGQILSTLRKLAEHGLEPGELERVKTRHRAELQFALDDASEMCGWYGAAELMELPQSYKSRLAQVMAVTGKDIQRLARAMFTNERALLTLAGPVDQELTDHLERLLNRSPQSTIWLNVEEDEPEEDVAELPIAS